MYCCLIYDLCLQKKAVYMLPLLVFDLIAIIIMVIVSIVLSVYMPEYIGLYVILLITLLTIMIGKDRVRVL
jgi:hypothetical protein